ncbi:hypothetical protein BDP81DRAFT_414580 [Colletotrichum phormii]|uniref:Uncharacterized protein n=1 Tax=Colletotrichum phormii TaxID=359342 RepID=A0AAJ0A568_9PEZI|nr:uncharacterized protein BDP81DRAFT_414580 [Colletotrichum phormii]KAK1656309.1 hypothetical protein BDP81DRAFT_414580 [Colletotrichum phormii]
MYLTSARVRLVCQSSQPPPSRRTRLSAACLRTYVLDDKVHNPAIDTNTEIFTWDQDEGWSCSSALVSPAAGQDGITKGTTGAWFVATCPPFQIRWIATSCWGPLVVSTTPREHGVHQFERQASSQNLIASQPSSKSTTYCHGTHSSPSPA